MQALIDYALVGARELNKDTPCLRGTYLGAPYVDTIYTWHARNTP